MTYSAQTRFRLFGSAVGILLAHAGCSSSPSPATATTSSGAGGTTATSTSTSTASASATSGISASVGGTGGSSGTGGSCAQPTVDGSGKAQVVETITAKIVDPTNAPINKLDIQVCGLDICLYGTTGPTGAVVVSNGVGMTLKQPAFKWGDGFAYTRFALSLPDQPMNDLMTLTAFALPATGAAFTPGANAISGGVTLSLPMGENVGVDINAFPDADQQTFRAVEIPTGMYPPAVDPSLNLEIVYGVGPIETTFCPSVGVSVPNTPAWPAGTAVEFYVHGVDVSQIFVPYGGWAKVSDGVVSADGKTVTTSADGGLPLLTVFGVRKSP